MWTYVLFNIKSNLKRKENLILIVLFIICEIALLFILNTKSFTESPYQTSLGIGIASVSQKNDPKLYQEFMDEVNLIRQTIDKGEQDGKEKNWKSYCEYKVKVSVLEAQWYMVTSNMPNDSYFEHADVLEGLRKEYGLPDLSQYEKLIVQKSNDINLYFCSMQQARYFDYLLKHDLAPITYSYVDASSVSLQTARYILPVVLPLLVGLLLFQQRERRAKTEKTILTISGVKKKYVRWNLISDVLFVLLVVFLPILVYMIALVPFKGVSNLIYPVLYYKPGFTGFHYWDTQGLDHIELVASGLTNMSVNQFTTPGMELMPLWQCTLFVAFGLVLSTIFYVLLITVLSKLMKNKYLSLLVFLVVLGLCSFASPLGNMQKINTFNPMSYRDFGMNLLGTSYFGYFAGIVIIGLYSVILYLVLKWCAKKVHV